MTGDDRSVRPSRPREQPHWLNCLSYWWFDWHRAIGLCGNGVASTMHQQPLGECIGSHQSFETAITPDPLRLARRHSTTPPSSISEQPIRPSPNQLQRRVSFGVSPLDSRDPASHLRETDRVPHDGMQHANGQHTDLTEGQRPEGTTHAQRSQILSSTDRRAPAAGFGRSSSVIQSRTGPPQVIDQCGCTCSVIRF